MPSGPANLKSPISNFQSFLPLDTTGSRNRTCNRFLNRSVARYADRMLDVKNRPREPKDFSLALRHLSQAAKWHEKMMKEDPYNFDFAYRDRLDKQAARDREWNDAVRKVIDEVYGRQSGKI